MHETTEAYSARRTSKYQRETVKALALGKFTMHPMLAEEEKLDSNGSEDSF
jgi:hypothetical protein